ncbi:MAG: YveK family protein, partial [Solirubrobacteraceae bacterium]
MSLELIIATVWKRKLIFLITLILCAGAVVAITFSLPKAYSATATMFIGNRSEDSASLIFDTNAGEQLTRTYTALAANPNVANAVRQRLPGAPSVESLLNRVSFSPVERTQLLEITATDDSPTAARRLANVYAGTFVAQVGAQFDRGAAPTQITLSQPAPLPISPSSPNTPLYLGFGVLLSLLLAVGATLLRDRFDDSLHLTPDADSVLGQPILLRLPELSRLSPVGRAAVQDALRLLRANIDFAQAGHSQVVAITSSAPVQGKSTTAAQLALTAAADGERTVLIEADLRRPGLIHTEIGKNMERSLVGLSNYLASMATSDEILTPHPDRPNLSIIWPGPLSPNPGVLLGSERLPA